MQPADQPPPPGAMMTPSPPPPGAAPPPGAYAPTYEGSSNKKAMIKAALRFLIIGMSVMMAAAGAVSLMSMSSSDDAEYIMGTFFIGVYVMMFAAILFFHELSQVRMGAATRCHLDDA